MPDSASVPADQLSYEALYARWEHAHWHASRVDFSADRHDWRTRLGDFERRGALWNFAMFLWGEDAVAESLAPFIEAAPRQEQKYLLATQQVDEARHALFFKRFICEVAGMGDGTMAGSLEAIKTQLPPGFVKTFELLARKGHELRTDPSPTALAQCVTLYHIVIEAMLAQPGQQFIEASLTERDLLPALRNGLRRIARDEQRHIALGVKLLRDLTTDDPEVPAAVAAVLCEALPHAFAAYSPPDGDPRYAECFGFTIEELFARAGRSFETKLRAAGLPLESLPGPIPYRYELTPEERARRGVAMIRACLVGERGPSPRDPARIERLVESLSR